MDTSSDIPIIGFDRGPKSLEAALCMGQSDFSYIHCSYVHKLSASGWGFYKLKFVYPTLTVSQPGAGLKLKFQVPKLSRTALEDLFTVLWAPARAHASSVLSWVLGEHSLDLVHSQILITSQTFSCRIWDVISRFKYLKNASKSSLAQFESPPPLWSPFSSQVKQISPLNLHTIYSQNTPLIRALHCVYLFTSMSHLLD